MDLWFAKVVKSTTLRLIVGAQLLVGLHSSSIFTSNDSYSNDLKLNKNVNAISDMTYRRRNAGVVCHDGLLFVVGGDDGSSNLSNVEVTKRCKFSFFEYRHSIQNVIRSTGLLSKD